MRAWALASVAVAGALALSCGSDAPGPPGPWHDEAGYRWRELPVARGSVGFTEMQGRRSGVTFENTVSDSVLAGNRILGQGGGVSLGDVDGDGLVDIFLTRTEGCNAMYRNLGGFRFEDVTAALGVGACDRYSTGSTLVDLEGDGDLDLILLATTGPNALFVNDGAGHFAERRDLGLDSVGRGGTTLTAADVDGDGWLDLYVANYKAYNIDDSIPPQLRAFNQMVRQVGPGKYEVVPEHARDYKVVLRPDMGGLRMTQRAARDEFYRNAGGRLVPEPMTGGRFLDAAGRRLTDAPESFALGAKFADLDGDGAPELFVANDFEDPDLLFQNDGKGRFRLADWRSLRQMSNSSMGVDIADVDGDGRPDVFEVDMLGDPRRIKTQIPTHSALPKVPGEGELALQQQRNTLFLNRGDGTFAEAAAAAGVQASGWSWGTMFLDVDLDGWQDILVTNGHLWDIMDADVMERLQNHLNEVDWKRLLWQFPPLRIKNIAFRNRGDATFEAAGDAWHFGTEEDISHGTAEADLDGDGDLDVVVNRLRSPALVLRNDATAPRISVRLVGAAPNTHAVGARIRLLGGAVPLQDHEVVAGGLYLSHSDYEAAFAMGAADSATLEVTWRDGRRTTIDAVRPGRHYEIREDGALPPAPTPAPPPGAAAPSLFVDASAELGGHRHVDPAFDDWDRQFLLPNALSQLGPGVTWFDLDRDGDDDLLVGAGRGGRLGVFRNDRGRLRWEPEAGPVAAADLTTILGLPEASGTRLLIGVSSWEGAPVSAVVEAHVAGGRVGAAVEGVVPARTSATGPLALGDYDGDGDLDLFVGGRAVPGEYPSPASSALYRNDGGRYVLDTANTAPLRDIGLVSSAMFADLTGDGQPDLVLAVEWGPVTVFMNTGGRLRRAPPSLGLDGHTSRWNGIAAGDLDGDGRLDLVATSWGRNTMTPADSANPLLVYYGRFGSTGEQEMFLARIDPRLRAVAPLNSYPRARVAIPDLASRVRTFGEYADASIDVVLGPSLSRTSKRAASSLDQMVFLNRGDHFESRALPAPAQLAPASYAGIADFDGDGREDLFLSQNFFPTAVGLPRYDSGRGLLLLGDGEGGLTPVSGMASGITVYGDQRGAAYSDFDGDGRLDLAVSQNADQTRLLRNRGARPGLRVRLDGPPGNPDGVGAQVRLVYANGMGPVREVQRGAGYWSEDGAVQVLGMREVPVEVWVRWPGGAETRARVPAGAREVRVSREPASR
ncbi:MAG: FG-GAP-like repeat-containing protein [Gemmatimonadota bacterium]|nr:FG-GAP-like repeat-containing protein [Gemmatimonadota bacterium]